MQECEGKLSIRALSWTRFHDSLKASSTLKTS